MIPKCIHYCWFGPNPLPSEVQECIATWKKYCSDYEIILWSEKNFPIEEFPFAQSALEAKKYAYIADICRVYVLYHYGGIYMDTDMELIKPIDNLLNSTAFIGYEDETYIAAGIIGSITNGAFVKDILDKYIDLGRADFSNSNFTNFTIPKIITGILSKFKTRNDDITTIREYCTIFPPDYFYPKSYSTGLINITKNSFGIHHYDATWVDNKELFYESQRKSRMNEYLLLATKEAKNSGEVLPILKKLLNLSNSDLVIYALKDFYKNKTS